ncbi:MAG: hypothetical protein ABWY78_15910 [Microvirga sp.]
MSDEEIEFVAEELAKVGGTSWDPGREEGSLVRVVSQRYRDRARIAIAALERYRAGGRARDAEDPASPAAPSPRSPVAADDRLVVGAVVIYRPPGDRRAYACRVEDVADGRVYLVPDIKSCTGWVSIASLAAGPDGSSSTE